MSSTSSPLPTRLVFLSDIPYLSSIGTRKIRFLGCVTAYSAFTGTLTLQHAYPAPAPSSSTAAGTGSCCPTAHVDVNLLLATLRGTDTAVGAWVNVVGYVVDDGEGNDGVGRRSREHGKRRRGRAEGERELTRRTGGGGGGGERIGKVQAVMLWSAGGVKLAAYEQAVEIRKKVELIKI